MKIATIAGLRAEIVGDELPPSAPLVVLLHGYDCFAGDLSPFAASLGRAFRYVFPEAPGVPAAGPREGRAWWPIDGSGRGEALDRGEARDLSDFVPSGLEEARERVTLLLDELEARFDPATLVIGGFSQGAMLTCDLSLRSSRRLGGLVLLSGARICRSVWRDLYRSRAGLPVFMSHGRADRDLAFHAAEALRDDLATGGLDVTWTPFDGGHEVGLPALRGLKRFLVRYAPAAPT